MNERIKQLALQAANEIADLFTPGFFDDRMVNDVAEINKKFAESLVKECANIALREEHDPYECIKKYFGVEE